MNLTLTARQAARACAVLCLMTSASLLHAQSEEELPSGAQMMEELVRLTMVPLSDSPLEFDGNLVYELTQQGRTSVCLLYTSPRPRDQRGSRMPSSA